MDLDRPVGEEARKAHARRISSGFIGTYLSGPAILDIGYKGYRADVVPIVPGAIGVELDYPGYDGVVLPFDEGSQDAVFASHCLEHIEDFQNAIRDWFRVLKIGGYLVIMVPHQFLYEKQIDLPSRYNADHKRFYTPASMMAEIEMSLRPNTYRLRHLVDNDVDFDYTIPPERHSGGCYELELIIEKIRPPAWYLSRSLPPSALDESDNGKPARGKVAPGSGDAQEARIVAAATGGNPAVRIIPSAGGGAVAAYDFGAHKVHDYRILALKLDHLGDFVIGLPSLRRLRDAFPTAHICLVVGSWNRAEAAACGLADSVVCYDYFPQISLGWDGKPYERLEKFRALTTGRYHLAIDLRVDDDTRFLLAEVDAELRCGIGLPSYHGFLDIALPPEHPARVNPVALDAATRLIAPGRFTSRMPFRHMFFHATDFRAVEGHVVYGPYLTLPVGQFTATFDIQFTGAHFPDWRGSKRPVVTLDVARNSDIVAHRRLRSRELRTLPLDGIALVFENDDIAASYEFRIYTDGHPSHARLRFGGVRIDQVDAIPPPRLRRAALHIGEQLSLLVQLVSDRTRDIYRDTARFGAVANTGAAEAPATRRIAIAPFSNSDLRDWPFEHYVALVRLLTERLDCTVTLLGSPAQASSLDRLVLESGGGPKVRNLGGQTAWADMPDILRATDLVVCNNSGIAHLAAACGARTLAIYSASHQPQEWGPRGQHSHALMAVVPCSPCGHDRLTDCPFEHRCMQGLAPEIVFAEASALLTLSKEAVLF